MPDQDNAVAGNEVSVGEALVAYLEARDVSVVFGIPGVHTVEMYRGLGQSRLHHVTPRHEQGAGFMADGYARSSGKPGVAFVITGPGMTNILTAMGQALADSIPMLVVSSVNSADTLGKGLGYLHELPDQHALCAKVAVSSHHVESVEALYPALDAIFNSLQTQRPGPHHIQVPINVFGQVFTDSIPAIEAPKKAILDTAAADEACVRLTVAKRPIIVVGGGSKAAAPDITKLSELLNAPVVHTINARGQMYDHPLCVPASPSLSAVRDLFAQADVVLAIGTEFGSTDYDMYVTGTMPEMAQLIRIDIDADQLYRHPVDLAICGAAQDYVPALLDGMRQSQVLPDWGGSKVAEVRNAARAELGPDYEHSLTMVEIIRDTVPGAIIVGDSTQPIYAANLYYDHDSPGGWFNSSGGFGTLGYAIPAAIGAALGEPGRPVVCLIGDGGAQFTLPELMTAIDEKLPITFVIWNNHAYLEIAAAMRKADVTVVGCHPTPPNFEGIAAANYMAFEKSENTVEALRTALKLRNEHDGPIMIEILAPQY
ncbi:5-guanidino-2-oxopentanoate decarboxylase [Paracoccaceae bacterium]|nr:5-guanidino-2-oxopentanoate decarboxylase [Paracoccaceae bacterium]